VKNFSKDVFYAIKLLQKSNKYKFDSIIFYPYFSLIFTSKLSLFYLFFFMQNLMKKIKKTAYYLNRLKNKNFRQTYPQSL